MFPEWLAMVAMQSAYSTQVGDKTAERVAKAGSLVLVWVYKPERVAKVGSLALVWVAYKPAMSME